MYSADGIGRNGAVRHQPLSALRERSRSATGQSHGRTATASALSNNALRETAGAAV